MTATKLTAGPLNQAALIDLVHQKGPCITLLQPPYRRGDSSEAPAALMRRDLHRAAKRLTARRIAVPAIADLLEPLQLLLHQEESPAGTDSARAIFRSHDVFRQFDLPIPPAPAYACMAGDCFFIRPILASLALPTTVYVLQVTKQAVQLLACGFSEIARVELPPRIPRTLGEAMGFDAPDHDLINRAAAGPSNGALQGVQFGTGSGREKSHAHLHDFYRSVDRGVNELLRSTQAPLVLCGVDEEVAMYRSISAYSNLLEGSIPGTGAPIGDAEMLRQAHDITVSDFDRRRALQMVASKERFPTARFSTGLEAILRAAVEGRVSDLYLDRNGQRRGTFASKVFGGSTNWHDEELLNVAAVETLLRGGAVYSLPTHFMPGGSMAAALFRY
jgi:hypothetical protein